ncbi:MAG: cyclic nucleotide-binding domain-containing protein [Deltaproteobacteria bacterium]|nr:cyclic nucleotide-binding domain-containing protein [Deltaproteobacteria bacterium]
MANRKAQRKKESLPLADIEFLMRTELLGATPEECKRSLISCMKKIHLAAGERFIAQGDRGDCFYLIQEGSCIVSLDKNGRSYPISRLKAGDLVGEVAIVTGETRSANVDAETDMVVWSVGVEDFHRVSAKCPVLEEFLADVATERLCSRKITAERSIGRYTIHDVMAEGGWSIVYKGVHSFLNLPVAVKMLKHNMARDSDFLSKFQDEAKIIAALSHENIVKVYDVEHMYRTVFIVMEYLDGVTLKHILKNKLRLPFTRMLHILAQVCAALDYAHQHGIVHQDVKPGNIFIEKNDHVKLVDFGLALPIGGCSPELPGTAFYMAPEQIESDPVDARTDIYSLGITAYEMATGQRPFPDDVCEVLKAHITQPTPDPRLLNQELPEEFSEFIFKATHKDPAARYENLQQALSDLNEMADGNGHQAPTAQQRKRRMINLRMFYDQANHPELAQLMAGFSEELKRIGAELRVSDLGEV